MASGLVCFDPDLLAWTDNLSINYQIAVEELTGAHMPDEFDPCVDAEFVRPSFMLDGWSDGSQSRTIDEYDHVDYSIRWKSFYQTRAGLRQWVGVKEQARLESPPEVRWGNTEQDHMAAIEMAAKIPDPVQGAITFAKFLAFASQTDQTLAAMEKYLAWSSAATPEFSLVRAYQLAKDGDLKLKIARDLLARFENSENTYTQHPPTLEPESIRLWQEWAQELVPIFVEAHGVTSDSDYNNRDYKNRLARALGSIGGDLAIGYLTDQVLRSASRPLADWILTSALDGLLAPQTLRHLSTLAGLAKLLEMPHQRSSDYVKQKIFWEISTGNVLSNTRVAKAVARAMAPRGLDYNDTNERLLNYIAGVGREAVPLLMGFIHASPKPADESQRAFRREVVRNLATIDDRRAAEELKALVRSGDVDAASSMVADGSPAVHAAAIELLSDPAVAQREKIVIVGNMGEYCGLNLETCRSDALGHFFRALVSLSRSRTKSSPDFVVLQTAMQSIILRSPVLLRTLHRYDERTQLDILGMIFGGLELPARNSFLTFVPELFNDQRLSPKVRQFVEEQFVELGVRSIPFFKSETSLPWILGDVFTQERFPASVRERIIKRLSEDASTIPVLFKIADAKEAPVSIRRQALFAAARATWMTWPNVEEEIVTRYILKDGVPMEWRLAAIDALKERARMSPANHEKVSAALVRCLPPPPAVQARVRETLRALR